MQNLKGKFPSISELEKIATISNYLKLYENDQYPVLGVHEIIKNNYKDKNSLVYQSHGIPERITEFFADLVAGDSDKLSFVAGSDDLQKIVDEVVMENDLSERIYDFATSQSIGGVCWLYLWRKDDKTFQITELPADQVFPQGDGSIIVATYKKDPADKDTKQPLCLIQRYSMQGDDCIIERSAWKCDEKGVLMEMYDLKLMATILGRDLIEETTTIQSIGDLPIKEIKNGRKGSDYSGIIPQLSEINERVTQNSTQFLKNLDAKMLLPSEIADENNEVQPFDYILMESKDSPEPKYITNTNPLLSDAREHIMFQIKVIEAVTGVPFWALTKGSAPEKVQSLIIQLNQALRKTERKRSKIRRALQDIFRMIFVLSGKKAEDVIIKFNSSLPTDAVELTDIETSKVTAGLSSRISSIMRLEGYTEEEAKQELARIKEDDIATGMTNPTPDLNFNNDNTQQ